MSEQHTSAVNQSTTPSDLVGRGFALFPLRAGTKVPAVARDWEHAATTSLVRLRRLTAEPRANYGIACGPSNLVVIDLDVAKGAAAGEPTSGLQVLRGLAGGRALPRTFTVSTPSGGWHLYFRPPAEGPAPRNTVRRLGPLIDTRGAGGYVVAPGSVVDGVAYRVVQDAPVATLPEWISALLSPFEERPAAGEPIPLSTALGPIRSRLSAAYSLSALEREAARVESARVGTRNDTLNRAAYSLGTLVGGGLLEQAQVEDSLTRAALAAGLDARETASTLHSGLTAGITRPRRLVGAFAAASSPEVAATAGEGNPAAARQMAGRALIPTLTHQTSAAPLSDWPRVFGRFTELGRAATAVRRELDASAPGSALSQASEPAGPEATLGTLAQVLDRLDVSYDAAARSSGAVAGSASWQGILALIDVLRDLQGELAEAAHTGAEAGSPDGPSEQAFGLVCALAAAAARRITALAKEIAVTLTEDGLRRSPLWNGLRELRLAADEVADVGGASAVSGTTSRYALGRGALQAQLAAMRRDLLAATRPRPATPLAS